MSAFGPNVYSFTMEASPETGRSKRKREAKAAFERRTQLKEYYSNAAKATAEGKKLDFYKRRGANDEAPAAVLGGNRFSRGGNQIARTAGTAPFGTG